ncbi:acyl carrier protein [Puteibacter caeruleilacunae]|nr:acyl carrier protein [Puteibacter caeruleilacunae]
MKEKFIELFQETVEIEDREIQLSDNFREYEEWDSLAYLSVIAMLDEEFEVEIEEKDFKQISTIGELIEEVVKRSQN